MVSLLLSLSIFADDDFRLLTSDRFKNTRLGTSTPIYSPAGQNENLWKTAALKKTCVCFSKKPEHFKMTRAVFHSSALKEKNKTKHAGQRVPRKSHHLRTNPVFLYRPVSKKNLGDALK